MGSTYASLHTKKIHKLKVHLTTHESVTCSESTLLDGEEIFIVHH